MQQKRLLGFFAICIIATSAAQNDSSDALLKLKEELDLNSALASWTASNDACSEWQGVICEQAGNTVIGLDLADVQLGGSLPDDGALWEELSSLQMINLANTSLNGTLPPSLSAIQKLQSVVLADNNLEGSIPKSWEQLAHLVTLDLSNNQLTGVIPVNWTSPLVLLDLAFNDLRPHSKSRATWSNMTSLLFIDLFGNEKLCNNSDVTPAAARRGVSQEACIPKRATDEDGRYVALPMYRGMGGYAVRSQGALTGLPLMAGTEGGPGQFARALLQTRNLSDPEPQAQITDPAALIKALADGQKLADDPTVQPSNTDVSQAFFEGKPLVVLPDGTVTTAQNAVGAVAQPINTTGSDILLPDTRLVYVPQNTVNGILLVGTLVGGNNPRPVPVTPANPGLGSGSGPDLNIIINPPFFGNTVTNPPQPPSTPGLPPSQGTMNPPTAPTPPTGGLPIGTVVTLPATVSVNAVTGEMRDGTTGAPVIGARVDLATGRVISTVTGQPLPGVFVDSTTGRIYTTADSGLPPTPPGGAAPVVAFDSATGQLIDPSTGLLIPMPAAQAPLAGGPQSTPGAPAPTGTGTLIIPGTPTGPATGPIYFVPAPETAPAGAPSIAVGTPPGLAPGNPFAPVPTVALPGPLQPPASAPNMGLGEGLAPGVGIPGTAPSGAPSADTPITGPESPPSLSVGDEEDVVDVYDEPLAPTQGPAVGGNGPEGPAAPQEGPSTGPLEGPQGEAPAPAPAEQTDDEPEEAESPAAAPETNDDGEGTESAPAPMEEEEEAPGPAPLSEPPSIGNDGERELESTSLSMVVQGNMNEAQQEEFCAALTRLLGLSPDSCRVPQGAVEPVPPAQMSSLTTAGRKLLQDMSGYNITSFLMSEDSVATASRLRELYNEGALQRLGEYLGWTVVDGTTRIDGQLQQPLNPPPAAPPTPPASPLPAPIRDSGAPPPQTAQQDSNGLAAWAIALIIIASVLLLLVLLLVCCCCKRRRRQQQANQFMTAPPTGFLETPTAAAQPSAATRSFSPPEVVVALEPQAAPEQQVAAEDLIAAADKRVKRHQRNLSRASATSDKTDMSTTTSVLMMPMRAGLTAYSRAGSAANTPYADALNTPGSYGTAATYRTANSMPGSRTSSVAGGHRHKRSASFSEITAIPREGGAPAASGAGTSVALFRNMRKDGPARTPRGTPLTHAFSGSFHPGSAGWDGSTPGSVASAPATASTTPKKRFTLSSLLPASPLRKNQHNTPFNDGDQQPRTLASRFGGDRSPSPSPKAGTITASATLNEPLAPPAPIVPGTPTRGQQRSTMLAPRPITMEGAQGSSGDRALLGDNPDIFSTIPPQAAAIYDPNEETRQPGDNLRGLPGGQRAGVYHHRSMISSDLDDSNALDNQVTLDTRGDQLANRQLPPIAVYSETRSPLLNTPRSGAITPEIQNTPNINASQLSSPGLSPGIHLSPRGSRAPMLWSRDLVSDGEAATANTAFQRSARNMADEAAEHHRSVSQISGSNIPHNLGQHASLLDSPPLGKISQSPRNPLLESDSTAANQQH